MRLSFLVRKSIGSHGDQSALGTFAFAGASLKQFLLLGALVSIPAAMALSSDEPSGPDPMKIEFFEKKIRPLLLENCINCHSAENGGKGELRVDDRNGLTEGGGRGPAIIPGHPERSLLIKAVKHQGALTMPPKKQLTDEQIRDLEQWILDGAAWSAIEIPTDLTKPKPEYEELRKRHWAWQPLRSAVPPELADASLAYNDIDRFVFAQLNEAGLKPVHDADKYALIRRITFDLTGLPPTPVEISEFVNDQDPKAFEKVVDRLLKSLAYGERWGRHWLDVARYGESTGSARNVPYPHAWRYRDYVIDSFASDKPYDQFIREQIAGDLLPANSPTEKAEQLVATGFLAIGVKDVNQRFKIRFTMDNVDEQIDTMSRAILGLTVSCARCHDHKFDPVPTVDYYALAGIFQSTDLCAGVRSKMGGGGLDYYDSSMLLNVGAEVKVDADFDTKVADLTKKFEEAKAEFEAIRGKPEGMALGPNGRPKQQMARQRMNRAQQELNAYTDPAARGTMAYGVREGKRIGDTQIRIRGEAEKLGPTAPRGFLSILPLPDQSPINPRQSGRLELAYWLTSDQNVLTQRVIVNRIWQHLFQRGIVSTADNFGTTGDQPTHADLLDYLTRQFVSGGWSVKKLVRQIVLSHAYQLSADTDEANFAIDPSNRFIWRHTPRRLDAEELRDSMLLVSGGLNQSRPEGSLAAKFKVIEIRNNGPESRTLSEQSGMSSYRSVYLPLVRGITPRSLAVFDFAEQGMVTGTRETTTVATQALYLLNDSYVRRQSVALAERLIADANASDEERVLEAYQRILGRVASPGETERADRFLKDFEATTKEITAAEADAVAERERAANEASALVASSQNTSESQTGTGINGTTNSTGGANTQAVLPPNPDDIDPSDSPVKEEVINIKDPRTAAWAGFCQALFGSAEFRYLK